MRTRVVLGGLAVAFAVPLATQASAGPPYVPPYERACTGRIDSMCYHEFCGIVDCVRSECVVYSGIFGDGNAGICVGPSHGRDW